MFGILAQVEIHQKIVFDVISKNKIFHFFAGSNVNSVDLANFDSCYFMQIIMNLVKVRKGTFLDI